jgi:sterol desaturase/sphingolipid hydroxylase (fatty acid hydroxylase superfamily)
MSEFITSALLQVGRILWDAAVVIAITATVFVALALVVKGRRAFADARRAAHEMRINMMIHILELLLVGPWLAALIAGMTYVVDLTGMRILRPEQWNLLPSLAVGFAAVFAGDFIGYWRHRLEHTRFLWPSHAVHHSDTELSWLTLLRFHPINRLSTTFADFVFLLVLGFPEYALVVSVFVRHNYGYLIHADLPWTYGKLGYVFVSPVMHQWHHARDPAAYSTNFATVFAIIDRAFGTFRVPGPCTVPLGVDDDMGQGIIGQLKYPFLKSSYAVTPPDAAKTSSLATKIIISENEAAA